MVNTQDESKHSHYFYQHLPPFADFDMFHQSKFYQALPDDWCVVITDVLGSTQAIEQGKYKQVNAVGVASIVALINCVKPLKVPYVFGGDGATACFPMALLDTVKPALIAAEKMSLQQFNLELRIGVVPMVDIRHHGCDVLVGKHQPHSDYQQAMFLGDGLAYAEKLVKDPVPNNPYVIEEGVCANAEIFEGFECRWNEIPSPLDENISLLVQTICDDGKQSEQIYAQVLERVTNIYGDDSSHHPLTLEKLSLTGSSALLNIEAGIRSAFKSSFQRLKYLCHLHLMRIVGNWLMGRKVQTQATNWGAYKQNLIVNTDYRKFDEMLRMVISGTQGQRQELRKQLQTLHEQGLIVFGIHAAPSSLITCVVTDYNHDHVHFLDGANGGYAMAAKELKAQLKSSSR